MANRKNLLEKYGMSDDDFLKAICEGISFGKIIDSRAELMLIDLIANGDIEKGKMYEKKENQ